MAGLLPNPAAIKSGCRDFDWNAILDRNVCAIVFLGKNARIQSGKCFIVTGANTGIGFEIARVLGERGARVLLACRDAHKADAAIARIKRAVPRAELAFLPLDLADLESVRVAAELAGKESRIDAGSSTGTISMPSAATIGSGAMPPASSVTPAAIMARWAFARCAALPVRPHSRARRRIRCSHAGFGITPS